MYINSSIAVKDNLAELLAKILSFTRHRHRVLAKNISNIHEPGFVPKDLAVEEFADLMDKAIDEHQQYGRILLRDTKNFKFGYNGVFEAAVFVDKRAKRLLETSISDYLEMQKKKLYDNILNYRVASELLRKRQPLTVINTD